MVVLISECPHLLTMASAEADVKIPLELGSAYISSKFSSEDFFRSRAALSRKWFSVSVLYLSTSAASMTLVPRTKGGGALTNPPSNSGGNKRGCHVHRTGTGRGLER